MKRKADFESDRSTKYFPLIMEKVVIKDMMLKLYVKDDW